MEFFSYLDVLSSLLNQWSMNLPSSKLDAYNYETTSPISMHTLCTSSFLWVRCMDLRRHRSILAVRRIPCAWSINQSRPIWIQTSFRLIPITPVPSERTLDCLWLLAKCLRQATPQGTIHERLYKLFCFLLTTRARFSPRPNWVIRKWPYQSRR